MDWKSRRLDIGRTPNEERRFVAPWGRKQPVMKARFIVGGHRAASDATVRSIAIARSPVTPYCLTPSVVRNARDRDRFTLF